MPQVQECYLISAYDNNSFAIASNAGDIEVPKLLPSFLSSATNGWYAESELPFAQEKSIGQTNLESELHRDFLLLKELKTNECVLHILARIRPAGMNKENYLLANEKALLQSMLRQITTQLIAQHANDKQVLKQLAVSSKLLKNEIKELGSQLNQQSRNYDVAITQFVQSIVKSISQKFGVEIVQSPSFISGLRSYNLPFEDLEENLSQHIQIELNLALASGDQQVVLMESHLKPLIVKNQPITTASGDIQLGRFTRTYKLLSKYEKAAELVVQQGGKIIGKNIAAACSPSISVPAITDSLNKHARKIYELFDRYPDKWPIIRREFRSVANIIEKEEYRRAQIA